MNDTLPPLRRISSRHSYPHPRLAHVVLTVVELDCGHTKRYGAKQQAPRFRCRCHDCLDRRQRAVHGDRR